MFKLTKLITFSANAGERDQQHISAALADAIRGTPDVSRGLVGSTLQGGVNCGDLLWHVQFPNEQAYRNAIFHPSWRTATDLLVDAGQIANVDSITYQQDAFDVRAPKIRNAVYRALILRLRPSIPLEKLHRFEGEMREMGRYVPAIRNWGFSRVIEGTGQRPWDYVWEQEFEDTDALTGPYMIHPYHFGWIDRWFDPESQDWILDTRLCHGFCLSAESMLTPSATAEA
jgi:Stress responsive A/B Barrel Domain